MFNDKRLNNILDKVKQKLEIKSKVQLINQDLIAIPAVYGGKNTKILLTDNILSLSDEKIELILLHELFLKKMVIYI